MRAKTRYDGVQAFCGIAALGRGSEQDVNCIGVFSAVSMWTRTVLLVFGHHGAFLFAYSRPIIRDPGSILQLRKHSFAFDRQYSGIWHA